MKIDKILILLFLVFAGFACQDELDTNPTDSTSGDVLFSDVQKANVALNGIYRAMYVAEEWSANWADEEFGVTAFLLPTTLWAKIWYKMKAEAAGSGSITCTM